MTAALAEGPENRSRVTIPMQREPTLPNPQAENPPHPHTEIMAAYTIYCADKGYPLDNQSTTDPAAPYDRTLLATTHEFLHDTATIRITEWNDDSKASKLLPIPEGPVTNYLDRYLKTHVEALPQHQALHDTVRIRQRQTEEAIHGLFAVQRKKIFPEIACAVELHTDFKKAGDAIIAQTTTSLLTAYGSVIKGIGIARQQARRREADGEGDHDV